MTLFGRYWKRLAVIAAVTLLIFLLRLPGMQNVVNLIVGIAWPATLLILVWLFRKELVGLLGRVKKIGKDGAEFDQAVPIGGDPSAPGPVTLPAPARSVALAEAGAKPPITTWIAPAFRSLYSQIVSRLKERLPAVRGMVADSDTDIAISWAAELGSALHLERASRSIFQSQVDAIDDLKWKSVTKDAFRPFYERAVQAKPAFYANYGFDQWFNFLVVMELVAGTDDAITVTAAGEALNMYMGQQRYVPIVA